MPDTTIKISALTEKVSLANNDILPILDSASSNANKKIKASTIATFVANSGTAPISVTNKVISIATANTSTTGALSSTDWNTFNGKLSAQTVNDSPTSPLTVSANTCYKFGSAITSLTISNFVTDSKEIEIQFTTGATFTFTASSWATHWVGGSPSFSANKSYVIALKNGVAVLGEIE